MTTWIRTNQGVASCVALAAIALGIHLTTSAWVFERLRDGFLLGSFTLLANFTILLCAVSIMIDGKRHEAEAEMADTVWVDWALAIGVLIVAYVYFELAWAIDFLLVTPFLMAAATYALGLRPLRGAILAGIAITIVVYIVFRLLGIPLPTNVTGL